MRREAEPMVSAWVDADGGHARVVHDREPRYAAQAAIYEARLHAGEESPTVSLVARDESDPQVWHEIIGTCHRCQGRGISGLTMDPCPRCAGE